uniref:Uncharacterized protein n=1 Tax=Xenopus tropicalis TaxID=8364 RepID=A0A6I8SZ38_XENTR
MSRSVLCENSYALFLLGCPCTPHKACVCSNGRPGDICSRVHVTAARLRMVGDELHRLTVSRKNSFGRKKLCSCFYLLYMATHLAALWQPCLPVIHCGSLHKHRLTPRHCLVVALY